MQAIKLLITLTIIFFNTPQLSSQENKKALEDSIKVNIYNNPDKALNFLHKYLKINKSENNLKGIIVTHASIAAAHEIMNQTDSTLFYHYKNLSITEAPIDIIQTKHSIARVLENKQRYRESLRLYYQTLDLAKKNSDLKFIKSIETYITSLKLRISKSNDAIEQLRKDYNYKVSNNDLNLRFVRKTLIEAYIKSDSLKVAEILIETGLKEAKTKNNCEFIYHMSLLKSKIDVLNRKLDSAKKATESALSCAKQLQNEEFINEVKYKNAEINYLNTNYEDALINLNFINDSNIKITALQKVKYYKLITDTHKALKNKELAENFYYKYLEVKQKVSEDRLATMETLYNFNLNDKVSSLQNNYKLELNQEISEKEKYKKTKWLWTGVSVTLLVLILILIFFFKTKSKVNQKRFDDLMLKVNAFEERKAKENKSTIAALTKETTVNSIEEANNLLVKDKQEKDDHDVINEEDLSNEDTKETGDLAYVIDDKKVEEILTKLQTLEDKMYFLRQDCTMHNMAKKLKTNTSYLSKIINTHLDKSFSTYINELRINYAIIELKNNKRLRSYSVKGIAEEMGYKNADAFSRYFRSATGISPSVYIKKIQEV
ncbi:helix-turn-helix domain-containing protein [Lacinutrix sp.]|uniref:helix-turn-helix domain-containing protein n=1 Tax=Lacinutrix sp. TaxID=1937692 RepID=UPI0025C46F31|nr:helix-turn-helix domain-containing protein [Lacinutrix sp.]